MKKKSKRTHKILMSIGFLCSIISGFYLLKLIEIPFGFTFYLVLYLFAASISVFLLSISRYCFRSSKIWLKITGIIPVLIFSIIIGFIIIISIDYRILYFRSSAPEPSKDEWIEDLHYLRNQMGKMHYDLNALIQKEKLDEAVRSIEKRIPNLSEPEILIELFRISSMPNDAHTFPFVMFPCFNLHTFPIRVYGFSDGWAIIDAGREYKDIIGAKVIKIGSKTIEDIYKKYPLFLAAESEYAYKARFPYMCFMAEWLVYHKIIENIDKAEFTLMKTNGEELIISIPSIRFYPHFLWSSVFSVANNKSPVFSNPRDDNYRFELIKETGTLYMQFNQCENQEGKETMDNFVLKLEDFVENNDFERFVIDLRNNDGGNRIWNKFVQFIRDNDKINRQGRLFVLIGRRTFSSAVLFASQLQMQTNAVFVGEPTGQGPRFYGGPKFIELPNSKLVFMVSTHLEVSGLPFEKRRSLIPDVFVENSHIDFLAGKDRSFDRVQIVQIPEKKLKRLPDGELKKYTARYLLNPLSVMDVKIKHQVLHLSFSDFIPGGLKRFRSKLFPMTDNSFETRISGMNIKFIDIDSIDSKKIILSWQGSTVTFNQAPDGYILGMELFSEGKIEAGCEAIYKNKDDHIKYIPELQNKLNLMGYNYMRENGIKTALHILKLNTKLYPDSSNTYDSYGEALLKSGNKKEAIKNYHRSLKLNPDNQNAINVLKELGIEL